MRRWLRPFWIVLALLFLLEAWLWDNLAPVVARIVGLIPWDKLKIRIAEVIEHLPPWAVLMVFVVPLTLLLVPLKFVEVWLFFKGYWPLAIAFLLLAKVVGVGITAFLFDVTRDKLMQMAWFRALYDWVIWVRDWANRQIEPLKAQLRRYAWLLHPPRTLRLLRRLMRMRRRPQDA
jgi:hypothetical protein